MWCHRPWPESNSGYCAVFLPKIRLLRSGAVRLGPSWTRRLHEAEEDRACGQHLAALEGHVDCIALELQALCHVLTTLRFPEPAELMGTGQTVPVPPVLLMS